MLTNLPIRTRLTLLYSLLLFLALVVFGLAAVGLLQYRLTARLEASLDRRAKGLEDFLRRETTLAKASHIPEEAVEYAFTQPEGHLLGVTDIAGRTILRSDVVSQPALIRERRFELYGQTYLVRAAGSLQQVEETTRELTLLLVWSAPLLLLVIGSTGYWISRRALAPVDQMTRSASSISLHNLQHRLTIPGTRDEISRLGEAWNEMLVRLEESISRMRRFTGDAAHELRTPLTALRTTAELALRRPRTPEEYRQSLEQVVLISERMTALADDLLALARGDEGNVLRNQHVVDVALIVRSVVSEMEPLFTAKQQQVELNLPDSPAMLIADAAGIRRILESLLDNATKYTPRGGDIRVGLLERDDVFEMQVADSGSGIPHDSIPHIFTRFYRVDESRHRQTGGHGLGLAIAQQIVHAHQGTIEAIPATGKGACFHVRIPKKQNDGGQQQ